MTAAAVTHAEIDALLQTWGRLVVCTVVRSQGSVPRHSGAKMAVLPDGTTQGTVGGGRFEALVLNEAKAALADGQNRLRPYDFRPEGASPDAFGAVCGGTADVFFEVVTLSAHLLIVGGGHCGLALARAASLLGDCRITLADERETAAVLPSSIATLRLTDDYAELNAQVTPYTWVVLVSAGYITDERALRRVIDTPACYIGMMGSRKKVRIVFDNLRRDGFSEEKLARVAAPIGLEIGAETPEEIAVSILAQIIARRRGAKKNAP